jgi:hypothetical protein
VTPSEPLAGTLAHALRSQSERVLSSWGHRFERSVLRLPRPVDPRQHGAVVAGLIEALGEATLHPEARLRRGGAELRELEKASSFAGGAMFAGGASGFDVAALFLALRDAATEFAAAEQIAPLGELFEWLMILALSGFATAGAVSATERADEQIEAGTPVVLITPDVPAVFLIGAPGRAPVDAILARAMLLVVRTGARTLILDVAGLVDAVAPPVTEAVDRLFAHPRLAGVEVALVGVTDEAATAWQRMAQQRGASLQVHDRLDAAFAVALDRAGCQLVRRR